MLQNDLVNDISSLFFYTIHFLLGGLYFSFFRDFFVLFLIGFVELLVMLTLYLIFLIKEETEE